MSRRSWTTAAVLVAVFLAGVLSGAAVLSLVDGVGGPPDGSDVAAGDEGMRPDGRDGPFSGRRGGRGDDPGDGPDGETREGLRGPVFGFARFLQEELDLSEETRARVQAVLAESEAEGRELFRESRQRFRDHLEETTEEIKAVLSPEEADEFQEMIDRMEERVRTREGRGDEAEVP